jgi:Effector Associated Constant Component 1
VGSGRGGPPPLEESEGVAAEAVADAERAFAVVQKGLHRIRRALTRNRHAGAPVVGPSGQLDVPGGVYGVRVEIRAVAEGDGEGDGDELRDFFRWLTEDEDGPEQVRLRVLAGSPADGAMGPQEIIDLVLTHGVALANLALMYVNWRGARGARPTSGLTFTRASDGLSVTVSGGSEEAVRQVLALLAQVPPVGPGSGSTRGSGPAPGLASAPGPGPVPETGPVPEPAANSEPAAAPEPETAPAPAPGDDTRSGAQGPP